MPRTSFTHTLAHTTDAEFRAWASATSTALKAVLTQTADTGQVDWTLNNQTRPATNTYSYYEVYRFNDALQSTKPVFIRFEYGTTSSAAFPGMRFTIGTGTNGAGTITGALASNIAGHTTSGPTGNTTTSYTCFKDGAFTFAWGMNVGNAAPRHFLVIDRTRDSNGNATGNGLIVIPSVIIGSNVRTWSWDLNANATTSLFVLTPPQATSSTRLEVCLYPIKVFTPDPYSVAGALVYKTTEITKGAQFTAAVAGGTPRTYVALGDDGPNTVSPFGTSDSLAILWED